MKKDYYSIKRIAVENFLSGKRDNPLICTNNRIAKKLQKNIRNITLEKHETVDKEFGLYMFKIIKK